jgi:hypothetical protein
MINTNFIAAEIARHCPNPTGRSKPMVYDIPLILWQVLLLAEDASKIGPQIIEPTSKLVETASSNLAMGGIAVAEGSLVRKVCGPIIARYAAVCVSRNFLAADSQRSFMRAEAELVFCKKFMGLFGKYKSLAEQEVSDLLSMNRLGEALRGSEANWLVTGQATCSDTIVNVIKLGRGLFK